MFRSSLFLILTLLVSTPVISQTPPTELDVELELYLNGFDHTVCIEFWDSTMFVVDQDGIIEMVQNDIVLDDAFLNITSIVQYGGERGLLGLAFDPGFDTNGTFYVNYINNSGNTVIASYLTFEDSLMGDPTTGNILLTMNQPYTNHNGGQIKFGPDGYLYIGMGDGGSAGDPEDRSQDPTKYMGKMLRIDVNAEDYSIPEDNPFIDSLSYLDEIWALGLRNPWRFSFDIENGDLWIGDVGQNAYEEINYQPASSTGGENWGWRCYEGFHAYNTSGCLPASSYDDPIHEYSHSGGHCSVTGGYVYRGADSDLLNGVYLGIDYCTGYLFGIRRVEDGDPETYSFGNNGFGFTTFGQSPDGEMYVAIDDGEIYTITDPCHTKTPTIDESGALLIAEAGYVSYEWYLDGEYLEGFNTDTLLQQGNGEYYYIVENEFSCFVQSEIIWSTVGLIQESSTKRNMVYPNPFKDSFNFFEEIEDLKRISLYSLDGKLVWQQDGLSVNKVVNLKDIDKGSYLLQVIDNKGNRNTQLVIKE